MASKGRWTKFQADEVVATKISRIRGCEDLMVCGSYRRGLQTVGDLDAVIVPGDMDQIRKDVFEMAGKVLADGDKVVRITTVEGVQIDFMFSLPENFHSSCLHLTGSKNFNIKCRKRAIELGLRLSQYGLIDEAGNRHGQTEEDILSVLGMLEYLDPRKRSL